MKNKSDSVLLKCNCAHTKELSQVDLRPHTVKHRIKCLFTTDKLENFYKYFLSSGTSFKITWKVRCEVRCE